jgi:rubrerythrin
MTMDRSPTRNDARSSTRSSDERPFEPEIEERSSVATQEDLLEEEEDLDPEIEALMGFAQMDLEAAAAYQTAAESIIDRHVADMLRGFAEDHQRHVSDIRRLVTEMGGEPAFASPDPEISTFATVTAAAAQFGTDAALRSLIASEQFTNSTYEAALELVTSAEGREVMERNLRDEQRHLQAITQEFERTVRQEDKQDEA